MTLMYLSFSLSPRGHLNPLNWCLFMLSNAFLSLSSFSMLFISSCNFVLCFPVVLRCMLVQCFPVLLQCILNILSSFTMLTMLLRCLSFAFPCFDISPRCFFSTLRCFSMFFQYLSNPFMLSNAFTVLFKAFQCFYNAFARFLMHSNVFRMLLNEF